MREKEFLVIHLTNQPLFRMNIKNGIQHKVFIRILANIIGLYVARITVEVNLLIVDLLTTAYSFS